MKIINKIEIVGKNYIIQIEVIDVIKIVMKEVKDFIINLFNLVTNYNYDSDLMIMKEIIKKHGKIIGN